MCFLITSLDQQTGTQSKNISEHGYMVVAWSTDLLHEFITVLGAILS